MRFSTVATWFSGPPADIAVLILFVPPDAIGTYESRGRPYSVARFAATLIPRMWSESASPSSSEVPGRASEPISRMKIGRSGSVIGR